MNVIWISQSLLGRYPTPMDGAMEIKEEVKKTFWIHGEYWNLQ